MSMWIQHVVVSVWYSITTAVEYRSNQIQIPRKYFLKIPFPFRFILLRNMKYRINLSILFRKWEDFFRHMSSFQNIWVHFHYFLILSNLKPKSLPKQTGNFPFSFLASECFVKCSQREGENLMKNHFFFY